MELIDDASSIRSRSSLLLPARVPGGLPSTIVYLGPPPSYVDELAPSRRPPWVTLTLRGRTGAGTSIGLEPGALDALVLVGREPRCMSGPSRGFSHRVSRVHLGLKRVGDGLEVLDLASLNGSYVDGRRLGYAVFREDTVIELGGAGDRLGVKFGAASVSVLPSAR